MSERDGSSFATAPVSSGGNRRPTIVAVIVVALVMGGFVLARLSPSPEAGREQAALTSPSPSASHRWATPPVDEPTATAMPSEEWFSALQTPVDDPLVSGDAIRWLRSARTQGPALATPGQDLLLVDVRGDTVCLCWQPADTESGDVRKLDLVRAWGDGSHLTRVTVMTVKGIDFAAPFGRTQVDLEPSPDGRLGYLARSVRSATTWEVGLDVIDLTSGAVVNSIHLLPGQGDPTAVVSVRAPILRVAPDGQRVLIMSGVSRDHGVGGLSDERRAWILELEDGRIGGVRQMDAIAEPDRPAESCSWITFVRPTIVADGCRYPSSDGTSTTFEVRRYELVADDVVTTSIYPGATGSDPTPPETDQTLIDVGAGVAYTWDPDKDILLAVSLIDGGWKTVSPPRDAVGDSGQAAPEARTPGPATVWADGLDATAAPVKRTLVGSPDGQLLYAVATGDRPSSTSGILVFDTQTGQIVDRWKALASYDAITLFENGRWLAALGRAGLTPVGGPADWGTSVTIHEVATGRPVLRIGDLAPGTANAFPFQGPLAAMVPTP